MRSRYRLEFRRGSSPSSGANVLAKLHFSPSYAVITCYIQEKCPADFRRAPRWNYQNIRFIFFFLRSFCSNSQIQQQIVDRKGGAFDDGCDENECHHNRQYIDNWQHYRPPAAQFVRDGSTDPNAEKCQQ